jgi:hypothetical protein
VGQPGACSAAPQEVRHPDATLRAALWDLASRPALSRDAVAAVLDVAFEVDASQGNPSFTFHVGRPRPGSRYAAQIASVDLRESNDPRARGVFVLVELRPDTAPTRDDVQARWGLPEDIEVVEPNRTVEVYYGYRAPGGKIAFGVAPGARGSVVDVSIDRMQLP